MRFAAGILVFLFLNCTPAEQKQAAVAVPGKKDSAPDTAIASVPEKKKDSVRVFHDTVLRRMKAPFCERTYDTAAFDHTAESEDPDELMRVFRHIRKNIRQLHDSEFYELALYREMYEQYRRSYERMRAGDPLLAEYKFPKGARIIEQCALDSSGASGRTVVLWVKQPRVVAMTMETYNCPEATTGKGYYEGPSYLSLLDAKQKRIINTLPILVEETWSTGADSCTLDIHRLRALPFSIGNSDKRFKHCLPRIPYHVIGGTDSTEGLAVLLRPQDFTGDGKKTEFTFYQQMYCMGTLGTVFGYSEKQDRLVQYEVLMKNMETRYESDSLIRDHYYYELNRWVNYVFVFPMETGRRKMEIDYRGRGGALCRYEVYFNAALERFEGVCDMRERPAHAERGYAWYDVPYYEK